MKTNIVRFRRMLSTTIFSFMVTNTLTMFGANKLPNILLSQIKNRNSGAASTWLNTNLYSDLGRLQRDPMPYLLMQLILYLIFLTGFLWYAHRIYPAPTEAGRKDSRKQLIQKWIINILSVAVVVLCIGNFSREYLLLNTRYELSLKIEAMIESVAPYISQQNYEWLRSDFVTIDSENDAKALIKNAGDILEAAKEASREGRIMPYTNQKIELPMNYFLN